MAGTRAPGIGRFVHYQLNEQDATEVNRRREDYRRALTAGIPPAHDGRQNHIGNPVRAGDIYPALIVRVWSENPEPGTAVNLQVFLDANDTLWATSRVEGGDQGQWMWPVIK